MSLTLMIFKPTHALPQTSLMPTTGTSPVPAVVVPAAVLPVPTSTLSTTNDGSLTSAPSAFRADPGSDAFILHTSLPKVIEGFLGVPSAIYRPS